MQGKHAKALELLDSAAGDIVSIASDRAAIRAGLLMVLGRLAEAAGLAGDALAADPDDFGQAMLLLDCLLPSTAAARGHQHSLIPGVSGGVGGVAERLKGLQLQGADDPAAAQEAVQQVRAAARAAGPASRGAELAAVELTYRQLLLGRSQGQQQQQQQQQLAEAMLGYFSTFGHLLSCAIDLRVYSRQLRGATREWLAHALAGAVQEQEAAAAGANVREQVQQLRRFVCAEQVGGGCTPPTSAARAAQGDPLPARVLG
jgi:N-terminal acetyltransferase B complex non-catalytic subunit